jgi:4-diphosphocytidyl-2-C-methyl-D-erythritol kinase
MPTTVRAFAKINIGLAIGALRTDGFHELRTIYQTVALHDSVHVAITPGSGIVVRCEGDGVPLDSSNTCYRMAERVMTALRASGKVTIEIQKKLPVQGGLGGASSDAIATLLAMERELGTELLFSEKLRLAAQLGSDLPLFLLGGTVLGVGRGEEVYPLPDLPSLLCLIATPAVRISTPQAFADWDALKDTAKLTAPTTSDRINLFSAAVFPALNALIARSTSGVPVDENGGRAETPLLDLVRTGIANDFEQVVFPQHPELSEIKRLLERAGAIYASLSGSGSAVFGLFDQPGLVENAARQLQSNGVSAHATTTLSRQQYRQQMFE